MLHEEVALYEKLTGQNANDVSITKIGAYLDGYEKGLSVLQDIKAEIDEYKHRQLPIAIGIEDLETGKQVAIEYIEAIIDKHISGEQQQGENT